MGFELYWKHRREINDQKLAAIEDAIQKLIDLGNGQNGIAEGLNTLGITTINGTRWNQPKVSQYMKRLGLKTKFVA
ncbi:hypothetical protein [Candidatus Thiodiazotropha endoloripes]|uniref:hypothetical protein n=1 Tax=Candidatus Thiodiazotropha endoloripes TaxID=1818881 RepID=UPI00083E6A6C|nr:hypothetical protein [Candidatus Thiodiazotropha endoloripes]